MNLCSYTNFCYFYKRFTSSGFKTTFAERFKQRSSEGKISLRRRQWKLSEKNVAMAIFLGKQYLGQSDKQESKEVSDIKITIDEQDRNL